MPTWDISAILEDKLRALPGFWFTHCPVCGAKLFKMMCGGRSIAVDLKVQLHEAGGQSCILNQATLST